eukprot:m.204371 g.204371  ORF g.204371 m.204371 type:complete len:357 (+) comp32884_c3_seq7:450-1520(+)
MYKRATVSRLGDSIDEGIANISVQTVICKSFPLTFEGYTYAHGKIAYLTDRPPAPIVIVHHNYAGLKQFDVDQACFLARAGYVGVAVDLYRETNLIGVEDQTLVYNFEDRDPKMNLNFFGTHRKSQKRTTEQEATIARHGVGAMSAMHGLLKSPVHWRNLMKAWLQQARQHPATHNTYAGAIGYCLGGQSLLEQVRAGHDLQAVVSFHGLLHSRPESSKRKHHGNPYKQRMTRDEFEADASIVKAANTYAKGCNVLIENGAIDTHVPRESIAEFEKEMLKHEVNYTINNHYDTPHGFALAPGVWATAYHEDADRKSTMSMLNLFAQVWPAFPPMSVNINACGTVLHRANTSTASKL